MPCDHCSVDPIGSYACDCPPRTIPLTPTNARSGLKVLCTKSWHGDPNLLQKGKVYTIAVVVLNGFDHTSNHTKPSTVINGVLLMDNTPYPYVWDFNRFVIQE